MTIEEIHGAISELEIQLHHAAATMELNNQLQIIHNHIIELQAQCPHKQNNTDYSLTKKCPICGKKFQGE